MLSHVAIKNFKSIGDSGVELELKPLTILVGPNGSGKSSILESLLLAWNGGNFQGGGVWAPWLGQPLRPEWLLHRRQGDLTLYTGLVFSQVGARQEPLCFTFLLGLTGPRYIWGSLKEDQFNPAEFRRLTVQDVPLDPRLASKDLYDTKRNRVLFVSGSRGRVPVQEQNPSEPVSAGIWGEHLLSYLAKIFSSNEYNIIAESIAKWAERFGVTNLKAGPRDEGSVGADYIDPDLKVALQMALSSTGARQVLTVIAHVFGSEYGSLIMIEEPEISLHPEAQVKLVEMFAEAIKENKQIIITTHSHYLLLALTEAVQRKLIKSEEVSIWEITKEREKGTVAKELPISEEGVIKGWVSSFARVDAQLLRGRARQTSKPRR